jgi:DNA-directed RNA polymerase beta subunit
MAAKMLFNVYQNVFMAEKEDISINAVTVHNAIYQLLALSYIDKIMVDNKVYGVLYSNTLIESLKIHKIGKNTLSKALGELKSSDLIECVNQHTAPAYRLTEKTNIYFASFKTNGGENDAEVQIQNKRKPALFSLGKKTKYEKTTKDYKKLLQEKSKDISIQFNREHKETFERFIDYHVSKGNSFANWLSSYRNWCRNAVVYESKNIKSEMYG